ncbi:MAG: fibronectin type III domain-containing protein [Steroidobacteraceae bacterium]
MSGNVLGKIIGRTLGMLCLTAALAACNDGSSGSSTADAASAQTVTVAANTAYSFQPQVASSAGSYSIVHKPAWANFNTITGELSGTPTSADAGQYSNIIISADANGSSLPLPPLSIIVTPAATPTADPVASTGPNPTGPSTPTSNQSSSSGGAGSSSSGNAVASGSSSSSSSSGTSSGATASNGGSSSSGSSGSGSSSGSSTTASSSITLAWDAPTENTNGSALTNLAGFQILYGTSSTSLTQTISINSVGILSYVVENLTPGTWYFEVVAVNSAGEISGPSTVVSATI